MATESGVEDEFIEVVLRMLRTTLREVIARSPDSSLKVQLDISAPDPKGCRDVGHEISERKRRYKYVPS